MNNTITNASLIKKAIILLFTYWNGDAPGEHRVNYEYVVGATLNDFW